MAEAEQFRLVIFEQHITEMDGELPLWPELRADLKLRNAEHEAKLSGVITPLLKEELWTKIQHARLERGLEELKVELRKPLETPLTNEEKTKVATRREKNREAAVRCRQKRKTKQQELEQILESETARHKILCHRIKALTDEKDWIMSQLGLQSTPPPQEEPACIWVPQPKEEPACSWTSASKEEPACSWTSTPKEEHARLWTPPPREFTAVWTPIPTPPPKEDTSIGRFWSITPPPQEKLTGIWTQQTPVDDGASPPPPECFSYSAWLEDELQVVPGEGCSSLLL